MIERVFEPFAQEPHAIRRSRGGLGLGLAIVRSLVELHEGTVTVRSDGLGKGSNFSIHLPAGEGIGEVAASDVARARTDSRGISGDATQTIAADGGSTRL